MTDPTANPNPCGWLSVGHYWQARAESGDARMKRAHWKYDAMTELCEDVLRECRGGMEPDIEARFGKRFDAILEAI